MKKCYTEDVCKTSWTSVEKQEMFAGNYWNYKLKMFNIKRRLSSSKSWVSDIYKFIFQNSVCLTVISGVSEVVFITEF